MPKEFRVDHDKLSDSQTITNTTREEFKKHGLNTHKDIALSIEDDPAKKQRIFRVKNTKYFGPWSHRG
jgi:hypothetical protein